MIHDLDDILISKRVYSAWLSICMVSGAELKKKYPDLRACELPTEQFMECANGAGQIFIKVR